ATGAHRIGGHGLGGPPPPGPPRPQRHGRPDRHPRPPHPLLEPRPPPPSPRLPPPAGRLPPVGLSVPPTAPPPPTPRPRPRPPNRAEEVVAGRIVNLAPALGLPVTAECVETSAQASRLRHIGCDTGQGWLYSRPVAPDRISELLGTRSYADTPVGNP